MKTNTISLTTAALMLKISYQKMYKIAVTDGTIKVVSKKNGIKVRWEDVAQYKGRNVRMKMQDLEDIAKRAVDTTEEATGQWIGSGKAATLLGVSRYHLVRVADRRAVRTRMTDGGQLRISLKDIVSIKNYTTMH